MVVEFNVRMRFFVKIRSGSRSMIQDSSNHGVSEELVNPFPEWIHRFF